VGGKKSTWEHRPEVEKETVSSIGISLDGTCMLMCRDGWRQAMVGSISYHDENGERLYTGYVANPPEHGKETFYKNFRKDIEELVETEVLDFFHASEYPSKASQSAFKRKSDGKEWYTESCHRLKHEEGGAEKLLIRGMGGISKGVSQKPNPVVIARRNDEAIQ
jgi:hypothetical protein